MNVLIAGERLLFRYGLDRLLIRLGQGIFERGGKVTVMASRFDRAIVDRFAHRIIPIPPPATSYLDFDENTAAWLERNWDGIFDSTTLPGAVVLGGWPFFSSIPLFRKRVGAVVFEDAGAVPIEGLTGPARDVQDKIRSLRRRHLPAVTSIVAISDFIARTQSVPDAAGGVPVERILLAADHVDDPDWQDADVAARTSVGAAVFRASDLKRQGRKLILSLGRWETTGYKNSAAAFDVLRRLRTTVPNATLLVLAPDDGFDVPSDLREHVEPIGHPDDRELRELMSLCDLGVSTSLWEGFNLPLAEMQWLGRPAFALNIGAHPEVIADPWKLCPDVTVMADKAASLLAHPELVDGTTMLANTFDRSFFRWDRVVNDHVAVLKRDVGRYVEPRRDRRMILLDVTCSARDPANPGIVRVTRRLGEALGRVAITYAVLWDHERRAYVFPTAEEARVLAGNHGPILDAHHPLSPEAGDRVELREILSRHPNAEAWLIASETHTRDETEAIANYLHWLPRQVRTAAIFYDAIPVTHPELCAAPIVERHAGYMRSLAGFDRVFAISAFSLDALEEFWREHKIPPTHCEALPLPGEFGKNLSRPRPARLDPRAIDVLCVSTIEPRKNHRTLVDAFLKLRARRPDLPLTLTLVGNRYGGADDLAQWLDAVTASHPEIRWLGIVDDAELHRLYQRAAFTVYPSLIEGYGLPILESLWHGRPCICHHQGAMAELIAPGGGLAVDATNAEALSAAIERIAGDSDLYDTLSCQAAQRPLKSWNDYAKELVMALTDRVTGAELLAHPVRPWKSDPADVFFPNCITDGWQMTTSERLGMTTLLARIEPRVAIEIGTYKGGSLSLLSQYAEMIFSIDIDPTLFDRFGYFENATFLTGYSHVVLPALLEQLDERGLYPDFLLIDGDHSAEGVMRDLAVLLNYVPKKPLHVLMHDSFNPDCRRGMLGTAWAKCPHVHHVDLDFVPGRVIESDDHRGQMWGGLGYAYMLPTPRVGNLGKIVSADDTYQIVRKAVTV